MSWLKATVFSDGASRGNPGPAGAGAVVVSATGERLALGKYLGSTTNNIAEYEGLLLGLNAARMKGVSEVIVCADSELLIKQLRGEYRVKAVHLQPLFAKAQQLLQGFAKVELKHVYREHNKEADEMSNRAIDEKLDGKIPA